jgi:hypothetical protein
MLTHTISTLLYLLLEDYKAGADHVPLVQPSAHRGYVSAPMRIYHPAADQEPGTGLRLGEHSSTPAVHGSARANRSKVDASI